MQHVLLAIRWLRLPASGDTVTWARCGDTGLYSPGQHQSCYNIIISKGTTKCANGNRREAVRIPFIFRDSYIMDIMVLLVGEQRLERGFQPPEL